MIADYPNILEGQYPSLVDGYALSGYVTPHFDRVADQNPVGLEINDLSQDK